MSTNLPRLDALLSGFSAGEAKWPSLRHSLAMLNRKFASGQDAMTLSAERAATFIGPNSTPIAIELLTIDGTNAFSIFHAGDEAAVNEFCSLADLAGAAAATTPLKGDPPRRGLRFEKVAISSTSPHGISVTSSHSHTRGAQEWLEHLYATLAPTYRLVSFTYPDKSRTDYQIHDLPMNPFRASAFVFKNMIGTPPPSRLRVNGGPRPQVVVDNTVYNVPSEVANLFQAAIDAGDYVRLGDHEVRSRQIDALPRELLDLIERTSGKGFRLRPTKPVA